MKQVGMTLLLAVLLLSFPAASSAETEFAERHVVLIYDDSGSMWFITDDDEESEGEAPPSDNWKLANYALQSLTALLGENDELNVIRMSDPATIESIALNYTERQSEINEIFAWEERGNTPLETIETSFSHLREEMEENPHKEYWFIIVMDGAFNELDSSLRTSSELEENYRDAYNMFQSFQEDAEAQDALFQPVFVTMESFLTEREQDDMQRFREEIWAETLDGRHLRAETQEEIIARVNEVAALITNRDENVENASALLDIQTAGNEVSFRSPYPLERITVLEQNMGTDTSQDIVGVSINGETDAHEATAPFQIETPYDEEELRDTIYGAVSHIRNQVENRAVPAGTYTIEFAEEIEEETYQLIAEPAIDLEVTYQLQEEEEGASVSENEYFHGSDMQLIARFVESGDGDEQISFSAEEAEAVEVSAEMGEEEYALTWDASLQGFTAPFEMPEEPQTATVSGYIPGFYQGEVEAGVSGVPPRVLELTAEHEPWSYPLNEWEEDHALSYTVYIDGAPIDEAELAERMEHVEVTVGNGDIEFEMEQEGSSIILTPQEPSTIFFQSTGAHEVEVAFSGAYAGEEIQATDTVYIEDLSFVEKYLPFLLWLLLLLGLLIYIIGLLRKARFDANRYKMVVAEQTIRHGVKGKPTSRTSNFKTPFLSKWLVPFIPEKKSIDGLTFIASKNNGQILLAKQSQDAEMRVGNLRLKDKAGRENHPLNTNTKITLETSRNRTTYHFTG